MSTNKIFATYLIGLLQLEIVMVYFPSFIFPAFLTPRNVIKRDNPRVVTVMWRTESESRKVGCSGSMPNILQTAFSVFFEYDTPKIVHIRSKKVGIFNRFIQLCIIGYVIGWVLTFFTTGRAKNHISPEEPYFATFYYYDFQYSGAKFNHFFEAVGKTRIGIHLKKKNEICFCIKWRNYSRFKISGEIWSPGEIWFFTLQSFAQFRTFAQFRIIQIEEYLSDTFKWQCWWI